MGIKGSWERKRNNPGNYDKIDWSKKTLYVISDKKHEHYGQYVQPRYMTSDMRYCLTGGEANFECFAKAEQLTKASEWRQDEGI